MLFLFFFFACVEESGREGGRGRNTEMDRTVIDEQPYRVPPFCQTLFVRITIPFHFMEVL